MVIAALGSAIVTMAGIGYTSLRQCQAATDQAVLLLAATTAQHQETIAKLTAAHANALAEAHSLCRQELAACNAARFADFRDERP